MKKKIFMTLAMGVCAFGLVIGGVNPMTEIPFELVTK